MLSKIRKFILAIFIFVLLFLVSGFSALAIDVGDVARVNGIFGVGSLSEAVDEIMDKIFSRMGTDEEEMQYHMQTMNVSRQKKNPPIVNVDFDPKNPAEGDKVTALATISFFMNNDAFKDTYFTWFLKERECDRCGEDENGNDEIDDDEKCDEDSAEFKKCNLNYDHKINVNDWKIKAMRIIANDDFNYEEADYSENRDNDGYEAVVGGDDQRGKNNKCYIHDTSTGDEYEITCTDNDTDAANHLFPNAPGQTTGDGSFGKNEEVFWRTDPESDDTAHTGNSDEANVAGLGINKFTWVFREGDKVGVVVEGISIEPTHKEDSSYRTMWAMPVSMCDAEPELDYPKTNSTTTVTTDYPEAGQTQTVVVTTTQTIKSRAATYAIITTTVTTVTTITDSITGALITPDPGEDPNPKTESTSSDAPVNLAEEISVANIESVDDLDECLYDNLISPAENGPQSEKLNLEMSYSPTSPMNDPQPYTDSSLSDGDLLIVSSSVNNAKDSDYLQYAWEVFGDDEPNPDEWSIKYKKSDLPESTQMEGIGLDTFKFRLNLTNNPGGSNLIRKYLKIKLTIKENVSNKDNNNRFREAHNFVVVPINSTGKKIQLFNGLAENDSSKIKIKMDKNEICSDSGDLMDKAICPISKNQIIGALVDPTGLSDFKWTLDGKIITYPFCENFEGCDTEKQTSANRAYFAVLKEKGERYILNLTATNKSDGKKVNISRTLEVDDPKVRIISTDKNLCDAVLLGKYIDLDGKEWPDYSQDNFWALSGEKIKLGAETSGFSPSEDKYAWFSGGLKLPATDPGTGIGFSGNKATLEPRDAEESYEVTVNALYSQNLATRKALNLYWNVPYTQLYEKMTADTITISTRNFAPLAYQKNDDQKMLASLFSSVPEYLAFLFRLSLTALLMIFTSRLILSLGNYKR